MSYLVSPTTSLPAIDLPTTGLVLLTLIAYYIAKHIHHKSGQLPLLHPILVSVLIVISGLWLFQVPYSRYLESNQLFQWLLGPAVVSLAIPLYHNLQAIRDSIGSISKTIVISVILGLLISWSLALLLGMQTTTQLALATKSVTTPIALAIAETLGGQQPLAATFVMLTGFTGALIGPPLLSRIGFDDHRIQGVALGLSAHAIGTQRALEISPLCGAFAALTMTLTGVFLALLLPLLKGVFMP